jgi:hypothetical protein
MSQFNRFLWTGLVLGLAACGDDVTVTNPPEPEPVVPGVTAVSVAPDGATINVGGNLGLTAAATLEPGAAAPTWAWSSSNTAIATVVNTTANPSNATVTGVAAGSAGIRATATSGTSSASGVATVFVTAAPACAITGVAVTPETASLVTNQSLQFAATVTGTNCASGDLGVTWTVVGSPAGATISSAGVFSATAAGNYVVRATSTKDATKTNTAAVTVIVPAPATVSIQSITQFATNVPVDLTNVAGQIEITLNVDPGAAPQVTKAQALIDGLVVAEQILAAPSAAASAPETAPQTLVLSTNTRQIKKVGNVYVPVVHNGPRQITARIFVTGSTVPAVSNAVPVVMQNQDAWVPGTTPVLAPASMTPTFTTAGPTVWYKGNVTVTGGPNYIAFFPVNPTINATSVCTSSDMTNGSPTTGITIAGTLTCGSSVEGAVNVTGWTVTGGTPPAPDYFFFAPSGVENVGSPYTVDGSTRYNLVGTGTLNNGNSVNIDNKAPTVSINTVAFNANYDQQWINASYAFSGPVVSSDAGTGVASEGAYLYTGTTGAPPVIVCTTALSTGNDLAESLTSDAGDSYQICADATDNLGNTSSKVGPSNKFGVDKTAPTVRLAGSAAGASPSIAPALVPSVSATANTTVYPDPASYAGMFWGLEGFDNRSGFNQAVVSGFDAAVQSLQAHRGTGCGTPNPTCVTVYAGLSDQLTQVLSDTWIRSAALSLIDMGGGTGYYEYYGYVIDRAGNQSTRIDRNFAIDLAAPATTFLAPAQTSYTPGQAGAFNIWAQDDLEVLNSYLSITYPGMGPPATGITYPYGSASTLAISLPWPTNAPIDAIVAQKTISIPNILGRVDESCTGAGVPYPSCGATPGSKATVAADYNWDLNLNAAVANNAAKAPVGVIANVQDLAGRDGLTGAAFSFNPATPMGSVAEQWSAATDIDTWTLVLAGTASCPTGFVCADQKTQTSNGLAYFESVALVRLNTTLNRWVLCSTMNQQSLPQVDNGVYRIWRYTTTIPTTGACVGAGFTFWRALGIKNGAGLFSLSL